jgi:hypothetical protein
MKRKLLNFRKPLAIAAISIFVLYSCVICPEQAEETISKHHVIFDTDANNEVDDQYALAYLLFSGIILLWKG